MSHENGALVLNQFREIYKGTGLEPKLWDPSKIAIIFSETEEVRKLLNASGDQELLALLGEVND